MKKSTKRLQKWVSKSSFELLTPKWGHGAHSVKEISTETEAKLVSTQISRVSDSRIGIKIIDRINEILFSVQNNEETIPFFKNSVRERFRLACPTTTRA